MHERLVRGDPSHRLEQGRVRRAGGRRPHHAVSAVVADGRCASHASTRCACWRRRTSCRSIGWSDCRTPGRWRPSCSTTRRSRRRARRPRTRSLLGWLGEAADYKIRYVPSTLPDLLEDRRPDPVRAPLLVEGPNVEQTIETTEAQLSWARHPDTEMECCSSTQALASFARGEGMWSRLRCGGAPRAAGPDDPLSSTSCTRRSVGSSSTVLVPLRRAGDGVRTQAGGSLPRPALSRADVSRARPHPEPPLRHTDPRRRRATDLDGHSTWPGCATGSDAG